MTATAPGALSVVPAQRQPFVGSFTPVRVASPATPADSVGMPKTVLSNARSLYLRQAGTLGESLSAARAFALSSLGPTQFACVDDLWHRESGWRWWAENKSSGAYGIPQALPGSKMAKAGEDWRTNPVTQVKWGLMYIDGRYGTACNAWRHFQQKGWY